MKDNWINHNTDKLLLFILVLLGGGMVVFLTRHGADRETLIWAESAFSTVLGALILILTGRVRRADQQPGAPPAVPTSAKADLPPGWGAGK